MSNNDTASVEIYQQLGKPISFGKSHRLQCFGHILNLTVKAFLFGQDTDAFEVEILTAYSLEVENNYFEVWWKRGPVGKLHNIVFYI